MKVDLSSIKQRLALEIAELVAEIEHLTPLAEAADAWVQAYENMDGLYNAEQKLLEAVKIWKQTTQEG